MRKKYIKAIVKYLGNEAIATTMFLYSIWILAIVGVFVFRSASLYFSFILVLAGCAILFDHHKYSNIASYKLFKSREQLNEIITLNAQLTELESDDEFEKCREKQNEIDKWWKQRSNKEIKLIKEALPSATKKV